MAHSLLGQLTYTKLGRLHVTSVFPVA